MSKNIINVDSLNKYHQGLKVTYLDPLEKKIDEFNNGVILGSSLPKNNSKGALVYASDGNFKVTNESNSIPILGLIYRAKTLADLKAITGITDVCFGLATNTGELYFYNRSCWNKIERVQV